MIVNDATTQINEMRELFNLGFFLFFEVKKEKRKGLRRGRLRSTLDPLRNLPLSFLPSFRHPMSFCVLLGSSSYDSDDGRG